MRGARIPYVEYHFLLVLICFMKSGISLDLGKSGMGFFSKEQQQVFGPLRGIKLDFKNDIQIKKRVANLSNFLNLSYFSFYNS